MSLTVSVSKDLANRESESGSIFVALTERNIDSQYSYRNTSIRWLNKFIRLDVIMYY